MLEFRLKSALNYEVVMQRNLNFKNCILWRTWLHRDKFNWMLYSSFQNNLLSLLARCSENRGRR